MSERRAGFGIKEHAPISPIWEETIAACLAKEPEGRPQSAEEFLRRLKAPLVRKLVQDTPVLSSGSLSQPSPRIPRSRKSLLGVRTWVGSVVIAVNALVVYYYAVDPRSDLPLERSPIKLIEIAIGSNRVWMPKVTAGVIEGKELVLYVNPELQRLRTLVEAGPMQLAEFEAGFTVGKVKVEAMKARLFARLRKHFQRRDGLRLVIGHRRKYLESLVRQGEEEAAKIAQEYQQANAQSEQEYADTAAALAK